MCGISGFFNIYGNDIPTNNFYRAHQLIAHRGPDDEGFVAIKGEDKYVLKGDNTALPMDDKCHIERLERANIILGHCRLSILDLSNKGHQPIIDETGRYMFTYNGEIYNYAEIKQELINKYNENFISTSDTEVVFKSLIHWGSNAVEKFNGMWAFAFYDCHEHKLLLSRDRVGVKPLFYYFDGKTIFFASEMKFIKEFCQKQLHLNHYSVLNYIDSCLLNFDNNTMWEEIKELLPGHELHVNCSGLKFRKYWNFTPTEHIVSTENALAEYERIFAESINYRMNCDVEFSASLSGGLDSNLVVYEMLKRKKVNRVFSIVFEENEYSEKEYIKSAMVDSDVIVQYIYPNKDEMMNCFDEVLNALEQPCRSMSTFSLYSLYKYIKEHTNVKVILNGQGSDELFSGYTSTHYLKIAQLLRERKLLQAQKEAGFFSDNRKIPLFLVWLHSVYQFLKFKMENSDFTSCSFEQVSRSPLREYLTYDDRLSMRFSLEARAPFVDYRLIEFAFSLHHDLKIANGINKVVPRLYAEGKISSVVVNRKDKMGFVFPQKEWEDEVFSDCFFREYQSFQNKIKSGYFPLEYLKYMREDFHKMDYMKRWRIVCFNRWLELNTGA